MLENKCTAFCGWEQGVKSKNNGHGCDYSDGGQKCPLTGTMSDGIRCNESTQWYCCYHNNWRDDPKGANQNLSLILSGKLKINPSWFQTTLNDTLLKLKESDPIIFVKDASSKEINEVNMLLIRKIEPTSKSLPYDKGKNYSGKGFAEDEILPPPITKEQIANADTSKFDKQAGG